jgi:hypothetical protein
MIQAASISLFLSGQKGEEKMLGTLLVNVYIVNDL